MSDKFRKIVNAPHKAFGRARKKIQEMTPVSKSGKASRAVGIGVSGMFQFLLWASKYAALDNHATRLMEEKLRDMQVGKNKKGEDKKLSSFAKKHPNLSSHILYYMMLAGLVVGGRAGYNSISGNTDEGADKTEVNVGIDTQNVPVYEAGTYGAYLAKIKPITPLVIANLIAMEGVHVENGMHTPYRDSNKRRKEYPDGIPTIGFGSTVLKDGTHVEMTTHPLTTEEAYELSRWHLEAGETFFVMYCYDVGIDKVDINTTAQAFGLASIIYNSGSNLMENPKDKNHKMRFGELRELYKEYGLATPDSLVRRVFEKYPVVTPYSFGAKFMGGAQIRDTADMLGNFLREGRGLYWRRWLEAGLMTGDITPEMMLDCPAHGMYEFFKVMGKKKSAFFTGTGEDKKVNRKTYAKFKEWLKNPVNEHGQVLDLKAFPRVKDLLPPAARQMCESGHCVLGDTNFAVAMPEQRKAETNTYVIGYAARYKDASDAFRRNDYNGALAKYQVLAAAYPNNALVHNDLAATYNKLGKYDDAIRHARIVLHEIGDKSQYSAAQYNAGFAYEKKGDLQRALANYKLALANGNRRVQTDITRVSRKLKSNQNGRGRKSAGKTAYADGVKNIRNRAHSDKLLAYNLGDYENGMA